MGYDMGNERGLTRLRALEGLWNGKGKGDEL